MKTPSFCFAMTLLIILPASSIWADDDCHDNMRDWQSRDALRDQLEAKGWIIRRIKVREHCYDVRAIDVYGNKIHGQFSPATFAIHELDVHFVDAMNLNDFCQDPTSLSIKSLLDPIDDPTKDSHYE